MATIRRSLLAVVALVCLVPQTSLASVNTRTFHPPWDDARTYTLCDQATRPTDELLFGTCTSSASAEARTGRISHRIDAPPFRGGHAEGWVDEEIADRSAARSALAVVRLRIDRFTAGAPEDDLLAEVWIGHSACECAGWSGPVRLARGDAPPDEGTVVVLDALLEEPGQRAFRGTYLVSVAVSATTRGAAAALPHTFETSVTVAAIDLVERR